MVEVFFDKMLPVVFSEDFNLAAEIIIGTPYQLVFALLFMLLYILSQYLGPTLIVTFNELKETSFVMSLQVFEHNHRCALVIRAHNSSIDTTELMVLKVLSFMNFTASIFE